MPISNKISTLKRIGNRLKDLLFMSAFLPAWRVKLNGKAMVYLYHRIGDLGDHAFLDQGYSPITSVDEFRSDIQTLKSLGAHFIRFSDLSTCDFDPTKFYVVICADDGFTSNYEAGQRICNEEGIPQTIFQCSAMVSTSVLIWEHQLYLLSYDERFSQEFTTFLNGNTNWPESCEQIRKCIHPNEIIATIEQYLLMKPEVALIFKELAKELYPQNSHLQTAVCEGHEVASHGDSHYQRSVISQEELIVELETSLKKLKKASSQEVTAFSHPFNSYISGDVNIINRYYSMVATVDGGSIDKTTNMMAIPRNTFPGAAKNKLRQRRWLLTGHI